MSSPNEPDPPAAGAAPPSAAGSAEVPPWQRAPRPTPPAPAPGPDPYADKRISRYVTGVAAPDLSSLDPAPPPGRIDARPERTDTAPTQAYPSELPNLSAPPRPMPAPRPPAASSVMAGLREQASRILVANRPRGPVRASMQIRRIDPWSTLRVSLLLSVALFFVWMIAVAFLYLVLGAMGVWSKLNSNVGDLLTGTGGGGGELVSAGSVFGGALLIGLVNIVLLTAMATVGAYIYNLSTDIVGGIEVTLADLD
ncbi:MAG: DUF3566 domain-containing protein [Mycobacterium sp.]